MRSRGPIPERLRGRLQAWAVMVAGSSIRGAPSLQPGAMVVILYLDVGWSIKIFPDCYRVVMKHSGRCPAPRTGDTTTTSLTCPDNHQQRDGLGP
jgi:hypothetical protein